MRDIRKQIFALLAFVFIVFSITEAQGQKPVKNVNLSRKYASVLVGGSANVVPANFAFAFLGGGLDNVVSGDASSLVGGAGNRIYGRYSFIGGGGSNVVSGILATAPGGSQNQAAGDASSVGGGIQNEALGYYSIVAGGNQNISSKDGAAVGGGSGNLASATFAAISGGLSNRATAASASIGGGFKNEAADNFAVVAGGVDNKAGNESSTICGGFGNRASGLAGNVAGGGNNQATGTYSTVPGGGNNIASGDGSFAAGVYANAQHHFSFVWGSSESVATSSFNTNSFTVRCSGGARFYTAGDANKGVFLAANGTQWETLSDSNAKTAFMPINKREVLAKVAAMPVTAWHYKNDPARSYVGPMAQDFRAAFGLGSGDKTIGTLDADGVAFAAIQGLVEELKERDKAIEELKAQNEKFSRKIEAVEQRLNSLPPAP